MMDSSERKYLYALLARIFSYPDRELIEVLEDGLTEEAIAWTGAGQAPAIPEGTGLRELETAYTGLFINRLGGAPAPPYGSVYLEKPGCLMGESSREVAEIYASTGLTLGEGGEPPDFLPTELEYLYYLVGLEEVAEHGKGEGAAEAVAAQADFCLNLLNPWVPAFCRRVEEAPGAHPFYLWACRVLEAFCRMEKARLDRST